MNIIGAIIIAFAIMAGARSIIQSLESVCPEPEEGSAFTLISST